MISRDFAQPKKEYLKKNKIALIIISAVVLVGLIVFGIFGLNGNPDFKGCNLVSINIGEDITNKEFDKLSDKIETVLAENKLDLYSVQIKGEGINTTLDVKYLGKVSDKKFEAVKVGFVAELDVEVSAISENQWLEKTVSSSDYIYTAVAILLVVLLASLFVLFRHNLSYALSLMGASLMSAIALICVFAIFRFEVSSAFFFAVVFASAYSIFEALILFENMRNVAQNPKYKDDKQNQIVLGVKRSANRMQFTTLGLFAVGLIFVIFGTSISRQVAISLMFSIIAGLSSVLFILPLIYNLTIDKVKIRKIKPKEDKKNNKDKAVVVTEKTEDSKEEKVQENEKAEQSVETAIKENETIDNENLVNEEIQAEQQPEIIVSEDNNGVEVQNEIVEDKNEEVVEEKWTEQPIDVEVVNDKAEETTDSNE